MWFGCFFFFQAEDGIRDRNVTGVQTCALPILHLSGRWAAKEAVSKVLGLGVRGVGWREIEIRRTRAGQPTVTLHGRAEARREAIGLKSPLSVSISHIRDLA